MSRVMAFLLALLVLALPAQAVERRAALVMGNGLYKHTLQLPNPPADAAAMAVMLKSLGFEVVVGTDLAREAMTETMSRFAQIAGGADVALFFYAGHAFQLDGRNLLVPVDAEIKSEFDAKQRAIEIDSVLQYTMADAKVKLVLLDGCRDNPFAKQIAATAPKSRNVVVSSGLAEMRPGEGTLIAFATGPGQVALDGEGTNSPFTRALLAHLPASGVEIRHVLTRVRAQVADDTRKQQLPWENTNMTGFFFMKPADGAASQAAPSLEARAPAGFDERALELELWSSIKTSTSADDFRAYLGKYPNGTFADVARNRVASLSQTGAQTGAQAWAQAGAQSGAVTAAASASGGAPARGGEIRTAEASKATEDALGLSVEGWKDVQRRLTGLGFATRSVDGRMGEGTRRGLASWQSARGYPATGYLNQVQHEALLHEVVALAPAAPPAAESKLRQQQQARRSMQSEDKGSTSQPGSNSASGSGGDGKAAAEAIGLMRDIMRSKGRLPF